VTFRLADTVVRFRYHVQKFAICTMVVPGLYLFSGVKEESLAGKCTWYFFG
jgi:hypothetical protein